MLACMMGGLAVCTLARAVPAESSDNPYQSIIDRNVFSLKPPPPPPDPAEANKPQVLKITLTGITTIFGDKRVLMKTAPPPGKPGEGPKTDQSYILTVGQREGDIEVIDIDEKAGSVKVNNGGTVQTLTFEKDGAKLPATPAPAVPGVPGAPQLPGLPVSRPGQLPATGTPNFQLPTRVPRIPTAGAQASGMPAGLMASPAAGAGITPAYGAPGFLPGNTTTPSFQNSGASPSQTQTLVPGGQLSLEEQAIMIEANRQAGGPGAALLPPTMLTPKLGPEGPGSTPVGQPAGNQNMLPMPGRVLPPGY
jgi:hypothetical protein